MFYYEIEGFSFRIDLAMTETYDTEQQRVIDWIKCIAFREAKDSGATFIDRKWIAKRLERSLNWVTDNWNKSADAGFTHF